MRSPTPNAEPLGEHPVNRHASFSTALEFGFEDADDEDRKESVSKSKDRSRSVSPHSPNLADDQKESEDVTIKEIPQRSPQRDKLAAGNRSLTATPTNRMATVPEGSGMQSVDLSERGEQKEEIVAPLHYLSLRTLFMGLLVSMGGLIFGFGGIGQIGGFLQMWDYQRRFADKYNGNGKHSFSDVRAGTLVGMVS